MPTCIDFRLYLPFKTFAFDQICTFCWLPDDGPPMSDKQVTNNIIAGDGVGLWGGSVVTCFYINFICIQETSS